MIFGEVLKHINYLRSELVSRWRGFPNNIHMTYEVEIA